MCYILVLLLSTTTTSICLCFLSHPKEAILMCNVFSIASVGTISKFETRAFDLTNERA